MIGPATGFTMSQIGVFSRRCAGRSFPENTRRGATNILDRGLEFLHENAVGNVLLAGNGDEECSQHS